MYLMIDNYDSFTYNLRALFNACGAEVKVIKNSEFIPAEGYEGIILSPGPSTPDKSGSTLEYLKRYSGNIPIFGVCLGMQSIGFSSGLNVSRANTVKHGKLDTIRRKGESVLFKNFPESFRAVRYHSLAVDFNDGRMTSHSESDSTPMSFEDSEKKLFGVQFHPESVLSEFGKEMTTNFIDFCKKEKI